jgi:hypothetical protein
MTGTDTLKSALTSTQQLLNWYVSDLTDEDLLQRPVPEANHALWQLGHLINAEVYLVQKQNIAVNYPTLPDGFSQRYTKETSANNNRADFHTKAELMNLFEQVRSATLAALDKLTDTDLDRPTQGEMAKFAPRLGDLFLLLSNHVLMHAGQFTVSRRKMGKPVLF